jgi:hypothetical protein
MKNLLVTILILTINMTFAQNDCIQNDGIYKYKVKLYIDEVSIDFDKNDFINHVSSVDNISDDDLAILNTNIILVEKSIPSVSHIKTVDLNALEDLNSILSNLNNSIDIHYCLITNCEQSNGIFMYYVLLNSESVSNDFDKNDFINYIISVDEISDDNLSLLNSNIITVSKPFQGTASNFLERVVAVDANAELFSIFENLSNSIDFQECQNFCEGDECLLGETLGTFDQENNHNTIVYPNPINQESKIYLADKNSSIKLEIFDNLGRLIHNVKLNNTDIIELKNYGLTKGSYFIKINNLENNRIETIKVLKK